jgi:ABC-type sugar transport system substrate-binding protein
MNMDNLLPLKDDMVAFIEGHGLKRLPGYVTEDIPSIVWEGSGNPDAWKDFVEMAKHAGAPFVTFSEMTLEREEIDALIDEANEMNFPDEETAELVEAQWLRKYAGNLGYIQLGFVYQGVAFLHETTTEWYERFQGLLEDIETFQEIVIGDQEHDHDDEDE